MWRARRYRYILAIVDRLPRDSHYVAAVADDDEIAAFAADGDSGPRSPSLTEFGPAVEKLTAIVDLLGIMLAVQTTAEGKKPRLPRPSLRPVTAADRLRAVQAQARRDFIAAQLWPERSQAG